MDRQPALDIRRARRSQMGRGQRERMTPPGYEQRARWPAETADPSSADALALRVRQLEFDQLRGR